jgi:leader peptidase (prepilin peptidase)/N-methyltransferase
MGCVAGVALWLIALTVCDIRRHRLPNVLTLPGAAIVVAVAALGGRGLPAVVGAIALGGGYLLIHVCAPAGMGAGDVKLALGLGALTGAFGVAAWTFAAVGAPILTAGCAIARRRSVLPHGPAMCLVSAVALALVV